MRKPKKPQPEPFDVGDFLRPTDTDLRSALSSLLHGTATAAGLEQEGGVEPEVTYKAGPSKAPAVQITPALELPSPSPSDLLSPLKLRAGHNERRPTKSAPPIVLRPAPSLDPPITSNAGPGKRQFAVRPAHLVEDGHSRAEQQVYSALWENATPFDDVSRLITLGFASMGKLTGLSESNARINLRSLIQKLAIDEHVTYDCAASQGRTYRVYQPAEIVRRRHAAGLRWVMRRTLAVVFVDPQTKLPLFTKTGPSATPGLNLPPSVLLLNAARGHLHQYGPVDPATVQQLVDACQRPGLTPEQLGDAIHEQGLLTAGMTSEQAVAFLLATVPNRLANA
jgi:hypothetical protein